MTYDWTLVIFGIGIINFDDGKKRAPPRALGDELKAHPSAQPPSFSGWAGSAERHLRRGWGR